MEILKNARSNLKRVAVRGLTKSLRYEDIFTGSLRVATEINEKLAVNKSQRVALLAKPGPEFVNGLLGTWLQGGISVPLCPSHPEEELKHAIQNSGSTVILTDLEYEDRSKSLASQLNVKCINLQKPDLVTTNEHLWDDSLYSAIGRRLSNIYPNDGALIIYTSGTTARPKGVLHTFKSLDAQVQGLCSSWGWSNEDVILHTLPLHHIHGIVNALLCPINCGASINFLPKFSPSKVWEALTNYNFPISVYMGVPTMYAYLISSYEKMSEENKSKARHAAKNLRLTVCGSAACPDSIYSKWDLYFGRKLLERYGMTETGMVLSNPYNGELRKGFVGVPLPGVDVQVKDGQLLVKSSGLFAKYWNNDVETVNSFDADAYFKTGDAAIEENGYWKILGRLSTDIIKSNGFKISAVTIESVLLNHPSIVECAVIGHPHEEMGEIIVAVVVSSKEVTLNCVRKFGLNYLPLYQLPHKLICLESLERNAMGKVNKKNLHQLLIAKKLL